MEKTARLPYLDYLKFTLTLFVIFHHIALMFSPIGAFASLVSNNTKNPIFDFIITYTDTFFMFSFFFISGIFFFKSLAKGGLKTFIVSRFNRLIIPFIIGWLFVNPIGYYVGYLSTLKSQGLPTNVPFIGYFVHEFAKGYQAGHLWFLWYLFFIQLILGALFYYAPKLIDSLKSLSLKIYTKPLILFLSFIGFAILSYWPLAYFTADLFFINIIGPFNLEISRAIAYTTFFLIGGSLGLIGLENSGLSSDGKISKYSPYILILGLLLSILYTIVRYQSVGLIYQLRYPVMMVLAVVQTIGFVGLFGLIFSKKETKTLSLLSDHSFAMYFYHYVIVAIIQFAFFDLNLNIWIKLIIINLITIPVTFIVAYGSRKIDFIRKVL